MNTLQPPAWPRPRGYANGIAARGTVIAVAGQIGWNAQSVFETDDLVGQVRQALSNVVAVLAEANAGPQHIVRMTWYLLSRDEYVARLGEIGAAYRELMATQGGVNYPAMTAVQVAALIEPQAMVEIEVTAILPD
jgi:enamine deaminase RidA (YjgF/YER057c/UK114 family)